MLNTYMRVKMTYKWVPSPLIVVMLSMDKLCPKKPLSKTILESYQSSSPKKLFTYTKPISKKDSIIRLEYHKTMVVEYLVHPIRAMGQKVIQLTAETNKTT